MKNESFELWLIWQNPETRQRYHVGNLLYEEGVYLFSYENGEYRRKLAEAMDNGYQTHLAFPDINKTYTSKNLFGPFSRRLPDSRMSDYQLVLQELGLSKEATELEVLLATGSILATDSHEFVSPIKVEDNDFELDFFIAGWRYYDGEKVIDNLHEGDNIKLCLAPNNEYDHKAVKVMSVKGNKLGFIPAFYSGWMFEIIEKECIYKAKIQTINPQAVPHRKVNISIAGKVNQFVDIEVVLDDKEKLRAVMS